MTATSTCWRRRCSACATRSRPFTATREAERDDAVKELGGKPRDHALQGPGRNLPGEFKQFIGKEMRLSQVEYAPKPEAAGILSFYMGKNTPERKDYIMDNLVVPVEE